ncbi:argininosuccinate lyase [Zopfochytrium polystomum]|nr:argininosuccinate lyase [Zopfochytrium polystomum]
MWGGRFTGKNDPLMQEFNASFRFDKRMWAADIAGSQTYARALAKSGVITDEEAKKLIEGLDAVAAEWANGTFVTVPDRDEDIHSANERRLGEIIGTAVSGKLHTGRSRNDQVATDIRLWLRDEVKKLQGHLNELIGTVVKRAELEIDVIMPGYTHLQRAQPIRWSHFLLSYAWSWQADAERLAQLYSRVNRSPLGSGALAGNPFGVDREFIARDLGFDGILKNSLHAVSDRDFIIEFLSWAATTMLHMSRISEDLIIYSSGEFGFTSLADAYSTGSSLMPQKKNPDSLELIRGKAGRVFGSLAGFMMTVKGLPSTYNKDMQEDKEPLFDAVDTVSGCLQILTGVLTTLTIRTPKMLAALSPDMLATDLAEYLVRKGVPFRETHHIAGKAVLTAEQKKVPLSHLTVADFKALHPSFGDDVLDVFNYVKSVDTRNAIGGTSRSTVEAQIEDLKSWLKSVAEPTA